MMKRVTLDLSGRNDDVLLVVAKAMQVLFDTAQTKGVKAKATYSGGELMTTEKHTVRIVGGVATVVYADAIAPLIEKLGEATVTRASNVEPHPTKPGVGWIADMSPSGGPVLGEDGTWIGFGDFRNCDQEQADALWVQLTPFRTREEALAAERTWLAKNRGL